MKTLKWILIGQLIYAGSAIAPLARAERPLEKTAKFDFKEPFFPIIPIKIGSQSTSALLDTGFSVTAVTSELQRKLELNEMGQGEVNTASRPINVPLYTGTSISASNIALKNPVRIMVTDIKSISEVMGVSFESIVGIDALSHSCLGLDFDDGCLYIGAKEEMTALSKKCDLIIPLGKRPLSSMSNEPSYYYEVELSDFRRPFILDTGSNQFLSISQSTASELIEAKKACEIPGLGNMTMTAGGLKEFPKLLKYKSVLPGFSPIRVQLQNDGPTTWHPEQEGTAGISWLMNWNWIFDFTNNKAFVGKSKYFNVPRRQNSSEISILKVEGKFKIVRMPSIDSPAGMADVQINDEILKCNDRDAKDCDLIQLRSLLNPPTGTEIRLQISRGGEIIDRKFTVEWRLDPILKTTK